jgi:hypothetical protein
LQSVLTALAHSLAETGTDLVTLTFKQFAKMANMHPTTAKHALEELSTRYGVVRRIDAGEVSRHAEFKDVIPARSTARYVYSLNDDRLEMHASADEIPKLLPEGILPGENWSQMLSLVQIGFYPSCAFLDREIPINDFLASITDGLERYDQEIEKLFDAGRISGRAAGQMRGRLKQARDAIIECGAHFNLVAEIQICD